MKSKRKLSPKDKRKKKSALKEDNGDEGIKYILKELKEVRRMINEQSKFTRAGNSEYITSLSNYEMNAFTQRASKRSSLEEPGNVNPTATSVYSKKASSHHKHPLLSYEAHTQGKPESSLVILTSKASKRRGLKTSLQTARNSVKRGSKSPMGSIRLKGKARGKNASILSRHNVKLVGNTKAIIINSPNRHKEYSALFKTDKKETNRKKNETPSINANEKLFDKDAEIQQESAKQTKIEKYKKAIKAVSYTHLTLPTICSV
eukprot:TRINITY_DN4635_c0_g1_i1.p1 TRINITY_DN4635_c0_g1~~TRINITY_DN4635_c0_g1_i1.p1  ORF type:complete len:261 (-),score=61.32 TRINITY_DN4635_c0_g1_i1:40-822(-)